MTWCVSVTSPARSTRSLPTTGEITATADGFVETAVIFVPIGFSRNLRIFLTRASVPDLMTTLGMGSHLLRGVGFVANIYFLRPKHAIGEVTNLASELGEIENPDSNRIQHLAGEV